MPTDSRGRAYNAVGSKFTITRPAEGFKLC